MNKFRRNRETRGSLALDLVLDLSRVVRVRSSCVFVDGEPREEGFVKRLLVLTSLALVAALIFAPAVLAQEETTLMTSPTPGLPPTGGISGGELALLAAALVLGAGVLSAAVLRRRRS